MNRFNWTEYGQFISRLANQFKERWERPLVIGIGKGGYIPSVAVSHALGECELFALPMKSYEGTKRQATKTNLFAMAQLVSMLSSGVFTGVVIVDDLIDTGGTVKVVIDDIRKVYNGELVVGVVVMTPKNSQEQLALLGADKYYFGGYLPNTEWIIFPYEIG